MESNSVFDVPGHRGTRERLMMRSVLAGLLLTVVIMVSSLGALADAPVPIVKNFIYLIGDGMSFEQLNATRIVKDAPLVMDGIPIQHQAYNASLDNAVTDSAAAGTALATGYRTNNGMVAMGPDGENLTSVLRLAKAAGKATGVVVTDILYGATPGTFIANAPSRNDHSVILEQAIFDTQPDVLLGGGMNVFTQIRAGDRLHETPYSLVRTRDELLAWDVTSDANLLGVFAPTTMTYEVDRPSSEPHIVEMVQVALDVLSQDENGFFLMIEGSRIDHAGHANDLRRMVYETLAFDEAIEVALAFAADRDDTVVIVTADHETGGLTPGTGEPAPGVISKGVAAVRTEISEAYKDDPNANIVDLFAKYAGITDLTGAYTYQGSFADLLENILEARAFYYTTGSHTAAPVPILAFGPGSERFLQVEHITDIGRTAIELLGLEMGGDQ